MDANVNLAEECNGGDSENDDDNEKEEQLLPCGTFKLRPSGFKGLPPTVYVDYPSDLGIIRTDTGYIEPVGKRFLHYKCAWERNCIKNGFQRAGFSKSDGTFLFLAIDLGLLLYICRELDCYVVETSNR